MNLLARILNGTRERLVSKGWAQGTYQNGSGQCCLIGARNLVANGLPSSESYRAYELSSMVINRVAARHGFDSKYGTPGVQFNDARGRTLDQVLGFLDECLLEPEAQEVAP